jgi:hypothetical protein
MLAVEEEDAVNLMHLHIKMELVVLVAVAMVQLEALVE